MSVAARALRPRAPPFLDPPGYARHRPEATLLYQLVAQHYPAFCDLRAESRRPLPGHAQQEFEAYLKCGRLEEGFMRHIPVPHPCGAPFGRANRLSCQFVLRVRCEQCHAAHGGERRTAGR